MFGDLSDETVSEKKAHKIDRIEVLETLRYALAAIKENQHSYPDVYYDSPYSRCRECNEQWDHKPNCPLLSIMARIERCLEHFAPGSSKELPEVDSHGAS